MVGIIRSKVIYHIQVHAKAMSRHYCDSHPDLLRHTQMHQDFIHGLANFGLGREECPMCRIKIQNVQKHQCCVVYQLAAMTGHIFQPEYFPIIWDKVRCLLTTDKDLGRIHLGIFTSNTIVLSCSAATGE